MKSHVLALVGVFLAALSSSVPADDFPSRPIRLVVPYAPGGGIDALTRRVAQAMSHRLGQPVFVENRGGAQTAIGVQYVAAAPADGYTLLFATTTSFSINPHVYRNLPYNTQDFVHLGMISETPLVMVSNAKIKEKTVADLIAASKKATEPPLVANNGKSGFAYLTAAMFYTSQSLPFVSVPYKGEGALLPDLLAGQVNYYFGTLAALMPHVATGELNAYAVTSAQRSPKAPNVPTFHELGIPVESTFWMDLVAPKNIPRPVFDKLADALAWAVDQAEVRSQITSDGSFIKKLPAADTEVYVKADSEKWGQLVRKVKAGGLDLQ